jgi:hypothetical protein
MHLARIRLGVSSRPQYASRGLDLRGCRIVFAHEISGSILIKERIRSRRLDTR